MLKFEVGKTYIMYSIRGSGHFRAKCVSRTPKTAKFEASDKGGYWYMPIFTLRCTKDSGRFMFDDQPMEVMTSRKGGMSFGFGIMAYACDEAVTPLP